jgi:hypothetical protein
VEEALATCAPCPPGFAQSLTGAATCYPALRVYGVLPAAARTDTPTVVTAFISGLDFAARTRLYRYVRASQDDGAATGGVTNTRTGVSAFEMAVTPYTVPSATTLPPPPSVYMPLHYVWNVTFTTTPSNFTGYHTVVVENEVRAQQVFVRIDYQLECVGIGRFLSAPTTCESCPAGAYCPGGARAWPLVGYWSDTEQVRVASS